MKENQKLGIGRWEKVGHRPGVGLVSCPDSQQLFPKQIIFSSQVLMRRDPRALLYQRSFFTTRDYNDPGVRVKRKNSRSKYCGS